MYACVFLDTQTTTSVAYVDPLQWHTVTDIVCGRGTASQFLDGFTAPTHIPVGEALRAAIYLTLNAARLLKVSALDKYLAAFILVQCKVSLLRTK